MGRCMLVVCLFVLSPTASAERVQIGPWPPERPWTVELVREPGVECTLTPEEVLDRVEGYSIQCTSFDKTHIGHGSGDQRPVWYVNSHDGGTVCADGRNAGSVVLLDDATGRVLRQDPFPCPTPPKRPEGPPAYTVTADPGVGCRMSDEEVAEKLGWRGIESLRCTTADSLWEAWGPEGRDRRVVWLVKMERGTYVIDDATGEVAASAGSGVRRGLSPNPVVIDPAK